MKSYIKAFSENIMENKVIRGGQLFANNPF